MSKDDLVEVEGVVTEAQQSGYFLVKTVHNTMVRAHLTGRMRTNRIRVTVGDNVTLLCSPYDMTKGRIEFRHK